MSELEEQKLDEYCYKLALKDAKEDGEKIGLSKGEKIGLSKGEKNMQIEIAKKSLEQKIDKKTISTITGLSIEEIESMQKEEL